MALSAIDRMAEAMTPLFQVAARVQAMQKAYAEQLASMANMVNCITIAVEPMVDILTKAQAMFAAHAEQVARIAVALRPLLEAIAEDNDRTHRTSVDQPAPIVRGSSTWTIVARHVAPSQAPPGDLASASPKNGEEADVQRRAASASTNADGATPASAVIPHFSEYRFHQQQLAIPLTIVAATLLVLIRRERPDWADYIESVLTVLGTYGVYLGWLWRSK